MQPRTWGASQRPVPRLGQGTWHLEGDDAKGAVAALQPGNGSALRPGLDPLMAALTVGGVAALAASAQEAARPFFETPPPRETWRSHLSDLLLHGLLR